MNTLPENVKIGDKFYPIRGSKNNLSEVVDFYEVRSMQSNEIIKYICMAKGINALATNLFEVPFSTVVRNKAN